MDMSGTLANILVDIGVVDFMEFQALLSPSVVSGLPTATPTRSPNRTTSPHLISKSHRVLMAALMKQAAIDTKESDSVVYLHQKPLPENSELPESTVSQIPQEKSTVPQTPEEKKLHQVYK